MTIGYTRRADLAGNTLKRLEYAVVRGSVRRRDPDGVVSAPYFDLGGTNRTLDLNIPGPAGFYGTVTFATQNATMQYVLDTINAAIGGAGTAYDLDGVVHIRSVVRGGLSYVAVLGGTAAAALGFSAFAGQPVESYGGDLPSTPEARRGNPPDAAFPSLGENLTTDSFVRALGRLAGNDDVLYSALKRPIAETRYLTQLSADQQTLLDASTGSVASGARVLIIDESAYLGGNPTPERIATAFVLIDETTEQPSMSRIIDFRKGGVSIFGNKTPLGTFPITEIRGGKTIVAPAGTFAATSEGQYVEITNDDSTANLVPWDHRGWWAVEKYVNDGINDFLTLRSLSPGELDSVGGPAQRPQAVTELNGTVEAGKTFGTVTLYEYPTVGDVDVIVSPPLPPGMAVALWGPQWTTLIDGHGAEAAPHPAGRLLVAQDGSLPTALLTAPTVSATGTTVSYTEFYVRWNGRKVRIPESSVSGDAIPSNGNAYALVWSSVSGRPEIRYAPSIAATDYLLARVWSSVPGVLQLSGGVRTDRLHGLSARYGAIIHVGSGQECPDIQTAYSHMRAIAAGNGGWPAGGATFVLHGPTHDIGTSLGLGTGSADGVLRLVGATGTEKIRPTSNALAMFQGVSSLFITDVGVDESLYTNWRWVAAVASASYVWRKPSTSPSVPAEIEWARGNGVLNILQNVEDGLYLARYTSTARPLPGSPDRYVTINGGKIEASIANTGTVSLAPGAEALEIYDDASVKRSLTWDDLDLLVEAKNADTLHKHKAIEAAFTIGASATPASANVTTANLNTLTAGTSSNADGLHDHNANSLTADAYSAGGLGAGTVQSQLRALADIAYRPFVYAQTEEVFPAFVTTVVGGTIINDAAGRQVTGHYTNHLAPEFANYGDYLVFGSGNQLRVIANNSLNLANTSAPRKGFSGVRAGEAYPLALVAQFHGAADAKAVSLCRLTAADTGELALLELFSFGSEAKFSGTWLTGFSNLIERPRSSTTNSVDVFLAKTYNAAGGGNRITTIYRLTVDDVLGVASVVSDSFVLSTNTGEVGHPSVELCEFGPAYGADAWPRRLAVFDTKFEGGVYKTYIYPQYTSDPSFNGPWYPTQLQYLGSPVDALLVKGGYLPATNQRELISGQTVLACSSTGGLSLVGTLPGDFPSVHRSTEAAHGQVVRLAKGLYYCNGKVGAIGAAASYDAQAPALDGLSVVIDKRFASLIDGKLVRTYSVDAASQAAGVFNTVERLISI